MTTKWYVGKDSQGIFAVYQATYNGKILTSEKAWNLAKGKSWEKTNQVSKWYLDGNDTVWEATEAEARSYLPASV
jgi:hypothetical protein